MKKIVLIATFVSVFTTLCAQQVVEDNFSQLRLSYGTPELATADVDLCGGKYLQLSIPGYIAGGEVGSPEVPVSSSLLTIPFCSRVEVVVEDAVYDTIHLGTAMQMLPMQPSRSKSDRSEPVVHINNAVYGTDAFCGLPLASVEVLGVARDRRLAQLMFSPVKVNPVSGDVVICRKAEVIVRYVDADVEATMEHFRRYHTPAFSAGETVNMLFDSKDATNATPIRMVIITPRSLNCKRLQTFANWKRTQGMMVDLVVTDEEGLTTNTSIANYLKDLYANATEAAPAPTYLLIVGDHAQIPAFESRLSSGGWLDPDNDHITDLYFVTWTANDDLPDCYQGRFSATDTTTVGNIVTKTLQYEKYSLDDASYLSRAALIAGVDQTNYTNTNDNGYKYADPNMDYVAHYYVNASNGFTNVTYYKNNTSFAPDGVTVTGSSRPNTTATALRNLYTDGVGWINYSAHGDWDEWSCPEFTVSNVSSMNNVGKPSFMIGNCCLSNKFDKGVCFGEALIRRGNRQGAVGYIGGTNSTYWTQDFYWSVGIRNNITNTMNASYNANNLGVYDRLFHTHGEAFSSYAVTAGKIVYNGNLAVQNSSSNNSMKKYYWEIYELMGDPSLMPWLGEAKTLSVSVNNTTNPIAVHTVPYAYVSVIDSSTLQVYAAVFTDAGGDATLQVPAGVSVESTFIAAIAQGYKPYFTRGVHASIDDPEVNEGEMGNIVQLYPNPATTSCTVKSEAKMYLVQVFDARGSLIGSYTPSDSVCVIPLVGLPRGVYMVQVHAADTVGTTPLIVK